MTAASMRCLLVVASAAALAPLVAKRDASSVSRRAFGAAAAASAFVTLPANAKIDVNNAMAREFSAYPAVRKSTSASGRPGGIIYYSGRLDAARECLASSHERLISAQVKYFCACERHCVVDRVPTAAATFGQRRRAGSTATMAS